MELDTTLTVVVGNLYRLLALKLSRYERAAPKTSGGTSWTPPAALPIDDTSVTCALNLAQPPPRPHRRRIRRPENADPLWDGHTGSSGSRQGDHQATGNLNSIT